ncbi:MAG: hypothetical protein CVV27_10050, partial [Candidatus Melainabacteria bacterium HGW-Melainabacteria-1]
MPKKPDRPAPKSQPLGSKTGSKTGGKATGKTSPKSANSKRTDSRARPSTPPKQVRPSQPIMAPEPDGGSEAIAAVVGDFQRIYGKHPIREALTAGRAVYKLWIAQGLNTHVIKEFQQLAREHDVPVQLVPTQKLNQLLAEVEFSNHQGLVAEIGAYGYADWDTWLKQLD